MSQTASKCRLKRRGSSIRGIPLLASLLAAMLPGLAAAQSLRVSADRASIRAQPSAEAAIVTTVERGTELDLLGTSGSWYRVRVRSTGVEGYIHSLLVDRQMASPQPSAPMPPSPSPVAGGAQQTQDAPRGFLSLNLGQLRPASKTLPNIGTTRLFGETATFEFPVSLDGSQVFELGAGVAAGWFTVGATLGWAREERAADLRLTLPHPFYFNAHGTTTSSSPPLRHSETALHLQFGLMAPVSETLVIALFGGPSYFNVQQALVSDVDVEFVFVSPFVPSPYDFRIANVEIEDVSSTGWGFNVGGDVAYFVIPNVGVGATIRFSRATLALKNAVQSTLEKTTVTADVAVGGLQFGVGARLRF